MTSDTTISPDTSEQAVTRKGFKNGLIARTRRVIEEGDAGRGLVAVLDQGIISGLSFVTSAIIADATGSVGLGIAHLSLTFVLLMTNVQAELVAAPFTVYRGRRIGLNREFYLGSALIHQTALTGVWFVALLIFLGFLAFGVGPTQLAPSLWVLVFAGPCCLLHAFLRHLSFACFQFRVALAMDAVVATLQLSLLWLMASTGLLTVPWVFAAMGVSCAVASFGWWLARPGPLRWSRSKVWGHWRENFSFGRWTLTSHVVGSAMMYVLPWLLWSVHGESATGTLAACGKVSALAMTFVLGVAHFVTPKTVSAYAARGVAGIYSVLTTAALVFSVTIGGFCAVVWIAGDSVMPLLFGEDFVGTGMITVILSFAVLANSLAVLAGNGIWVVDRPQANLVADVSALVATLATALWLVHVHGALGIAISILVGGCVGAVVRGVTLWLLMRSLMPEPATSSC